MIAQRQELDRRSLTGGLYVVMGVVGIAAAAIPLISGSIDDGPWAALRWALIAFWFFAIGLGIFQLSTVRSAREAFEAKHGANAGRQQPIK